MKSRVVNKGQWYVICCHRDLCEADDAFKSDEDSSLMDVFESEKDGLEYFINSYEESLNQESNKEQQKYIEEDLKDCRDRLEKLA